MSYTLLNTNVPAQATTPLISDNSSSIATTAYVNNLLASGTTSILAPT
jgi:hypothetical protein